VVRPITFLSDYGLADEFVGVVHGVIARLAPEARVIDLGHGIPRQDVRAGALALERALPFMPAGVHLAVVDPEVGARRRAVALRTADEDRLLVGPDNGLLIPAAERFGGCVEAVDISSSPWRLEPVSATFHGRDVFAPVAARLAAGEELQAAGEPLEPDDLVALDLPEARVDGDDLVSHVVGVDRFGNVLLDATHDLARDALRLGRPVRVGERDATFARTFADVGAGELLLYEDAGRRLALAVNSGDAAAELRLQPGDEIRLSPS
jgi:S-adenosyl-L-methionine hydrolase (adenosine-forming)